MPSRPLMAVRSNRARHSLIGVLATLMVSLVGCASVPDSPGDVEPPPQLVRPEQVRDSHAAPPPPTVAPPPPLEEGRDAAGAPEDPLNPDQSVRLNDARAHENLWARIRATYSMPDLADPLVTDHEQWYAARPDYVERMTTRGSLYLYHIVEETQKRNMPVELALLPFIESAFNPKAMSSAKASGMWQFIPSTGRDYALKQNLFRDDRRDVLASTRAALDYLKRLYGMFGDWHLALAAYNWGEGNVGRAIARNQAAGLPTDYLSLSMPAETRHYVPKLQAVKNIVRQPDQYGLRLPELQNHPYFLTVPIERDIDVALAARLAGMGPDQFKSLNPQMNKPVILAAGTPRLLLPYDNASQFISNLSEYRGRLASWTAWTAPRTMKMAEAAQTVGMSESELRSVNQIPPKMMVTAGSTLLVARDEQRVGDVSGHVADNARLALKPEPPPFRRVMIEARRGDTLASLAKRYRFTVAQLAQWNHISPRSALKRGQSLAVVIPYEAPNPVAVADPRDDRGSAKSRRHAAHDDESDRSAAKSARGAPHKDAKGKHAARDDEDDARSARHAKGKSTTGKGRHAARDDEDDRRASARAGKGRDKDRHASRKDDRDERGGKTRSKSAKSRDADEPAKKTAAKSGKSKSGDRDDKAGPHKHGKGHGRNHSAMALPRRQV